MELVVAVAVSVLTIIFLGSIIALILICRQRLCNHDMDTKPILKYSKDELVTTASGSDDEFRIEEVTQLSPNIGINHVFCSNVDGRPRGS
ncbi:unnamed protein product [Soboliphyme baturini]|uniref:Transmembrane protein 98 n=1 Tax=Soboliphyme baturini TaxID=241478 RepID=A0A183ISD8_9BILA|nr:unnamed protein product [Soboliphyme baturini]